MLRRVNRDVELVEVACPELVEVRCAELVEAASASHNGADGGS